MSDTSIVPLNRVKAALQAGQSAVGTMVVEMRQPAVMQLLANAGFDFAIIDNEHGGFSIESIGEMSRVGRLAGLTPVVRVPAVTYPYLAQALDVGAQGIMLPRITDPRSVREAVQMMKFPPMGNRGNALSRGHTDFRAGSVSEAMADLNEASLLIVQIETRAAVNRLEDIVCIPGVDVALVGPNDLSISLGIPGQLTHPAMEAAMEEVINTCEAHGVVPGLHINDVELAAHWATRGMRLISCQAETVMIVRAGLEIADTLGQALSR